MNLSTPDPHLHVAGRNVQPDTADALLAGLAAGQHGVVSRRQMLALGLSKGEIDGRLERGSLHRIHRGVYSVGHTVIDRRGRWLAAVFAGGEGAALSHRSAGELWGLVADAGGPIEVSRPTRGWRSPRLVVHQTSLGDDELEWVGVTPVTCASRTILDLAGVLRPGQLQRALNEMEVRRLRSRVSIPDLLKRYPRRRGAAALRRLLAEAAFTSGLPQSVLEERFLELLESRRLPRPEVNRDIRVRGRFLRPDCLWPAQRVIVELDGRAAHGTPSAFERDKERDRILLAEGWRVIRITWRALQREADSVLEDVRRALDGGKPSTSLPARPHSL